MNTPPDSLSELREQLRQFAAEREDVGWRRQTEQQASTLEYRIDSAPLGVDADR